MKKKTLLNNLIILKFHIFTAICFEMLNYCWGLGVGGAETRSRPTPTQIRNLSD